METVDKEKQFFILDICSVCGLCENPLPDFCMVLYDSNPDQFIKEIVYRINTLKSISSKSIDILFSFEGFCRLFCKKGRCPLYNKQCDSKLSTQVACYESFISQNSKNIGFMGLSTIYRKWAGIESKRIGEDLDPIIDISDKPLSKSKRRKLRKAIKRAKKRMSDSESIKLENRGRSLAMTSKTQKKEIETSFFCNSNNEWREKITQYLIKNERYENDNR